MYVFICADVMTHSLSIMLSLILSLSRVPTVPLLHRTAEIEMSWNLL